MPLVFDVIQFITHRVRHISYMCMIIIKYK